MANVALEPKAFLATKDRLNAAERKLVVLEAATDHSEIAELWADYLSEHNRVYLKLRKATERGPAKGWFDKRLTEQRADELLSYLLHARNAFEHGIEAVTVENDEKHKFDQRQMMVWDGGTTPPRLATRKERKEAPVHFISMTLRVLTLSPILDRGITYSIPNNHLGKPFSPPHPKPAARAGFAYLQAMVAEAETLYGN